MRNLILILSIALISAQPGLGAEKYVNARYGATANIPDGFAPMGPEAANSDGLIFRSRQGGALITIFGGAASGGFEAAVNALISHDQTYNSWNVSGKTITPDWAEYQGNLGARQLRVRVEAACSGRTFVAAKLEYNGNMDSTVSRVLGSLEAGPSRAC